MAIQKSSRRLILGIAMLLSLVASAQTPVLAVDTPVTVVVTGPTGSLSISAVTTAVSSNANNGAGATTSTLALGAVTVTETRVSTPGWTATAISTDLTSSPNSIAATAMTYSHGTITGTNSTSGANKVNGQANGTLANVTGYSAIIAGTSETTGTTIWSPSISVAVSAILPAGSYAGTVTHSVA